MAVNGGAHLTRKTMINIELTEAELQQLINLMDAGVKAAGLQSVMSAAGLLEKFEEAVKASKSGNVVAMKEAV